jgi:hypothetical protein
MHSMGAVNCSCVFIIIVHSFIRHSILFCPMYVQLYSNLSGVYVTDCEVKRIGIAVNNLSFLQNIFKDVLKHACIILFFQSLAACAKTR